MCKINWGYHLIHIHAAPWCVHFLYSFWGQTNSCWPCILWCLLAMERMHMMQANTLKLLNCVSIWKNTAKMVKSSAIDGTNKIFLQTRPQTSWISWSSSWFSQAEQSCFKIRPGVFKVPSGFIQCRVTSLCPAIHTVLVSVFIFTLMTPTGNVHSRLSVCHTDQLCCP